MLLVSQFQLHFSFICILDWRCSRSYLAKAIRKLAKVYRMDCVSIIINSYASKVSLWNEYLQLMLINICFESFLPDSSRGTREQFQNIVFLASNGFRLNRGIQVPSKIRNFYALPKISQTIAAINEIGNEHISMLERMQWVCRCVSFSLFSTSFQRNIFPFHRKSYKVT